MKRSLLSRAAGAALAMAVPGAAPAELPPARPTGSMLLAKAVPLSPGRLGELQVEFGRCLYGANPRAAVALLSHSDPLAADLAGAGIRDARVAFDTERCLRQERGDDEPSLDVAISPVGLRALLLEPVYLAIHARAPSLSENASEVLPRTFVTTGDQLTRARQLAAFGDCVVFHGVAAADRLVRTVPGTSAEARAARVLAPALGKCVTKGQRFGLTPKSIRAVVADGLWTRFARVAPAQ